MRRDRSLSSRKRIAVDLTGVFQSGVIPAKAGIHKVLTCEQIHANLPSLFLFSSLERDETAVTSMSTYGIPLSRE